MNIQDWLNQLISRPAAEPLDWERYSVSMTEPTWKALWREIQAAERYEDGLEVGFRLLHGTQQHRARLGPRGYQANRILLYRSILTMLDKGEWWEAYLAAWESIRAQTSECRPLGGDAPLGGGSQLAPSVRWENGRFGAHPHATYPKMAPVHFLDLHLRRKALIERKLEQERTGKHATQRRPVRRSGVTINHILSRRAEVQAVEREKSSEVARP